jgi:hypothetical protein
VVLSRGRRAVRGRCSRPKSRPARRSRWIIRSCRQARALRTPTPEHFSGARAWKRRPMASTPERGTIKPEGGDYGILLAEHRTHFRSLQTTTGTSRGDHTLKSPLPVIWPLRPTVHKGGVSISFITSFSHRRCNVHFCGFGSSSRSSSLPFLPRVTLAAHLRRSRWIQKSM